MDYSPITIEEIEPFTQCPLCDEYIFSRWTIRESQLPSVHHNNCTIPFDKVRHKPEELNEQVTADYFVIDHNGPRI